MRDWRETLVWWPILVLVWLATLNSFSFAELITAGVCAVPCAVLAPAARRAAGGRWPLRWRWFAPVARLPWTIVRDSVRVLTAARTSTDEFQHVPLAGPPDRGHEAIATLLVGASPGSVVVDSVDRRELVVHPLPDAGERR